MFHVSLYKIGSFLKIQRDTIAFLTVPLFMHRSMTLTGTDDCIPGCISNMDTIPIPDVWNLNAAGRMNFPGTQSDSNWT